MKIQFKLKSIPSSDAGIRYARKHVNYDKIANYIISEIRKNAFGTIPDYILAALDYKIIIDDNEKQFIRIGIFDHPDIAIEFEKYEYGGDGILEYAFLRTTLRDTEIAIQEYLQGKRDF